VNEDATEPLLDAQRLEQPLLLGDRELDVAGHEVGEASRVGDRVEHLVNDFLGESAPLAQLRGPLARLLVQGDKGGIVDVAGLHLLGRDDDRVQVPVRRAVLEGGRALLTLEQELDATEPALNLTDAGDDAHRVENVRGRLVGVVALRDGKDQPLPAQRGFDRAQGSGSSRGDGRREAREDYRPPQRKDGKGLTLCHKLT
jgi:hypothetical protein